MVNELNESLNTLGELMADNLNSMGVDAEAEDGLTTLVDKILDITPSVGGINVLTNITCNANDTEISVNNPVTVSGVLSAEYDDTSQVNTDFKGFLTGATVKIYDDERLLGTTITDNNGVYSFTYTPLIPKYLNIKSVFEGTTFFEECVSNIVIVDANYTIIDNTEHFIKSPSTTTTEHSLGYDEIGDYSDTDFELTFKYKFGGVYGGVLDFGASSEWDDTPKSNYRICLGGDTRSGVPFMYCSVRTTTSDESYGEQITTDYYDCKILREGDTVKFYMDNKLIATKTQTFFKDYHSFSIYGQTWSQYSSCYIKDIKLKVL